MDCRNVLIQIQGYLHEMFEEVAAFMRNLKQRNKDGPKVGYRNKLNIATCDSPVSCNTSSTLDFNRNVGPN
jgi:hypothetical protein